jgi:hypothetical protein
MLNFPIIGIINVKVIASIDKEATENLISVARYFKNN